MMISRSGVQKTATSPTQMYHFYRNLGCESAGMDFKSGFKYIHLTKWSRKTRP
jgi:hypothetical protein